MASRSELDAGTNDFSLYFMSRVPMFLHARRMLLFALLLIGAVGCATSEREDDGRLHVVSTTNIIGDLVGEIGGEFVQSTPLMGPGVDPHLYKASEGDVSRMARADVILYNGLHLEGKMTDVFEQMARRGIPVYPLAEESVDESTLIESDEFSGNYDPHVWFDVSLWKRVARRTAEILSERMPEHASDFDRNLETYLGKMDEHEQYVRERVDQLPEPQRILVTSHDAFGYFGRAYGFDVRGLQGISTATEAGTADVQALADFVARRRLPALFVESSVSPRGIEAVREAVRAQGFEVRIGGTLYGDALGDAGTEAGTYLGMIKHNVDTIVEALSAEGAAGRTAS